MEMVYLILLLLLIGLLFYNEMYLMSFVLTLITFVLYAIPGKEKKVYTLEEITSKVQSIIDNNKAEM